MKNNENRENDEDGNETECSDNEEDKDNHTNINTDVDKDVTYEIAAGNDTGAPTVNICEDVLMMVKNVEMRGKIEDAGDYQHQLTLEKMTTSTSL